MELRGNCFLQRSSQERLGVAPMEHREIRESASPQTGFPDCAEPVIGRRFAPTRWLHPGYRLFRVRELRLGLVTAEEDEQARCERQ